MPTSSTASKKSRSGSSNGSLSGKGINNINSKQRTIYWPNENTTKINIQRVQTESEGGSKTSVLTASGVKKSNESSSALKVKKINNNNNKLATLASKYNKISHISPPTSLTSTSVALRNSIMVGGNGPILNSNRNKGIGKVTISSTKLVQPPTTSDNNLNDFNEDQEICQQPVSLSTSLSDFNPQNNNNNKNGPQQFAFLGGKSFLINAQQQQHFIPNSMSPKTNLKSQSQSTLTSLNPNSSSSSNASSTAQLQMLSGQQTNSNNRQQQQQQQLHIGRRVDLKYVKSLIIILMAADLLVTVFVHQFATNDELNLSLAWLRSIKLRLSLINLVLSSIWFLVLVGGILFDIYYILFVSVIIDLASFLLLLALSVIHFTRRIDYNTVQLTSLLALLFSIVVLHVYTLVMAALTLYLMMAVKRRQRNNLRQTQP